MPKACDSVVDCALVLFSIFGLSALHQEFFFSFSFYLYIFLWDGAGGGKKRAVMGDVMTVNPVSL